MRVGYKLRREIEDLFPERTTPGERLVALQIADDANERTRISLIDPVLLCARCGLAETGLKDALARLLKRGLEFRVSHGEGKDGRPVYAARNHPPEYRVPSFEEFMAVTGILEGEGTASPSGPSQAGELELPAAGRGGHSLAFDGKGRPQPRLPWLSTATRRRGVWGVVTLRSKPETQNHLRSQKQLNHGL